MLIGHLILLNSKSDKSANFTVCHGQLNKPAKIICIFFCGPSNFWTHLTLELMPWTQGFRNSWSHQLQSTFQFHLTYQLFMFTLTVVGHHFSKWLTSIDTSAFTNQMTVYYGVWTFWLYQDSELVMSQCRF